MVVNADLNFVAVLFVIMTNVAKIRRMEENIMLILHHGGLYGCLWRAIVVCCGTR